MPKVFPEYKENVKARIFEAAITVFREKGYNNSRNIDIAQEVGLSVGITSYYFQNRRNLLLAVAAQALSGPFDKSMKLENYQDLEDSFQTILKDKDGLHLNFEIAALAANDADLRKIYRKAYQEKINTLKKFIKTQQIEGEIRKDRDAEVLALQIMALYNNIAMQLILDYNTSQINKQWKKTLHTILKK